MVAITPCTTRLESGMQRKTFDSFKHEEKQQKISKGAIKSRSKQHKVVQESKRRSGGGIIIKEGDR